MKAIAYLKNDKEVWDKLNELKALLTDVEKILPEMKTKIVECFSKLAGEKLQSITWVEGTPYEGIRDMEDGTLDLLGTIKCTFAGVPNPIGFVMLDGHGFVNWMQYV